MAWLGIFIFYLRGYARARILVWIHFILPPYTREKNHLDNAGIEPGSPAPQASMLSIMPSPLGLLRLVENVFSPIKTQQAKSGTSAATYELAEPHSTPFLKRSSTCSWSSTTVFLSFLVRTLCWHMDGMASGITINLMLHVDTISRSFIVLLHINLPT